MTKDYDRYRIVIEATGDLHPDIHILYGKLREVLEKEFMDTLPKIRLESIEHIVRSDVLVDNTRK